jgi:hypothetical protein
MNIHSTEESPVSTPDDLTTADDWTDVLEIPGDSLYNNLHIINEGDNPGWWRLKGQNGVTTSTVRLPAGGGDTGQRRAAMTLNIPGLAGHILQVKKELLGGRVTDIHAIAHR